MLISIKSGIFKILIILLLSFIISESNAIADNYRDNFPDGKAQLRWNFFPHFFLDNLTPKKDKNAPDGDGGIGVLSNSNAGGFAALSYAVTEEVSNFYLEAFIYCPISNEEKGPFAGLAFLIDPVNSRFYRFICDFNGKEPSLNVAYIGRDTRHFPIFIKSWNEKEIPGGVPKKEGWHKMALRVKDGKAKFFWNDKELSGVVDTTRVNKGFVGVYTNFVGGLGFAEVKVDSFFLKVE